MDRNSGIPVAHARDRSMQPRSDLRVIVRCRLTARSRRKWTNRAGLRRQTEIDIEAKRAQEVARAQEKAESVPTEKTIETLERWKNHHGTLSEKAEGASFEAHARIEAVLHDVIREPQGAEVTGGLVFAGVMLLAFFVAGLSDPPWEGDDE